MVSTLLWREIICREVFVAVEGEEQVGRLGTVQSGQCELIWSVVSERTEEMRGLRVLTCSARASMVTESLIFPKHEIAS